MGERTAVILGAGLLAGVGKGMMDQFAEDGRAKREMMLEELRQQGRAAEGEKDRAFRAGEGEKDRAYRGGLLNNTERFTDDQGRMWERTPKGVTPVAGPDGKQLVGTTKTDLMKDPLVEVYDEDSPTGSKLVPQSQASGQPSGKDVTKRLEGKAGVEEAGRRDARKQAEKEAADKAGWLSSDSSDFKDHGGSRSAFVEGRTNEILTQRKGKSSGGPTSTSSAQYEDADAVKRAYRAGRLSREDALKKLKQLGYED